MTFQPLGFDSGSFLERIEQASETLIIDNIDPSGSDILKIGGNSRTPLYIGSSSLVFVSGSLSSTFGIINTFSSDYSSISTIFSNYSLINTISSSYVQTFSLSSSNSKLDDIKSNTISSSFFSGTYYGDGLNLSGVLQNYNFFTSSFAIFTNNTVTTKETLYLSSSITNPGNYYINWYSEYTNGSSNGVTGIRISINTGSNNVILGEISPKVPQSLNWVNFSGYSINYLNVGNYSVHINISASSGIAEIKNQKIVLWKLG